jgi:hypothetical protein
MSRRVILGVAATVAALGVASGCGGEGGSATSAFVQLREQGGSGQSGTATLTAQGDKTTVAIELSGPAAGRQPSHVHQGTCANPNPRPAFPLTSVEEGRAETTVDVSLDELQGDKDYYVNVHKSDAEIETVVACGNLLESGGGQGGYGGGY